MARLSSSKIFLKVTLVIFLGRQAMRNHCLLAASQVAKDTGVTLTRGVDTGVTMPYVVCTLLRTFPPGVRGLTTVMPGHHL